MKHFLNISDHEPEALRHVLAVGRALRAQRQAGEAHGPVLAGRTLAMYFEKPSLRTRLSFDLAVTELGGHPIVLTQAEVGLGERESVGDFTRVVHGMAHGIAARVFDHRTLLEMASLSEAPVINMLSDQSHPCQALADVMTLQDEFGEDLTGRTVAFVGDGNNVAYSLAWLCAKLGVGFVLASPASYQFPHAEIERIREQCGGAAVRQMQDPAAAVAEADAVYCDTFVSMGQEADAAAKAEDFADYVVNEELMDQAPAHAIVLHCLPAHRGVEITDGVMDGPRSRVFPQAHNRLHAQKGLLAVLMGGR